MVFIKRDRPAPSAWWLGVLGAVRGMPAAYGLTTEQAVAIIGPRSVWWTLAWVLWSVALTAGAFWRAWWMKVHEPHVRFTAGRGALWLWGRGAIGAPWVYPSLAWDLPLYDVFGDSPPRSAVPIVSAIASAGGSARASPSRSLPCGRRSSRSRKRATPRQLRSTRPPARMDA